MRSFTSQLTNLGTGGLDGNGIKLSVETDGFTTLSLQLAGTISAHEFTLEGTIDGTTWVKIPLVNVLSTGAALATGNIIAAGIYRVNCAGLRRVQFTPAASFAGTGLQAIMAVTEAPSLPVVLT